MAKIQQLLITLLTAVILFPSCMSKEVMVKSQGYLASHLNDIDTAFQGTGMFYNLPRTAIVVDIEVKKTTKTPGPYASYASRFLGLENIITSSYNHYEIHNVSISSFSEPDPDQVFFVSFPDVAAQNMYITLNEAGIICSVNNSLNESAIQARHHGKTYHGLEQERTFNYFIDQGKAHDHLGLATQRDDENVAVQRQTLRRSWVEKSTELRAREVADYILEIREKKFDLISGFQEIAYSKEALEYMYNEMNNLESDYLDLFTGITSHKIINYRYVKRPSKKDIEDYNVLFWFSPHEGIMASASKDAVAAEVQYAPVNATQLIQQQINKHTTEEQNDSLGFHYRIPEFSEVNLYLGGEARAQARMLVNQFGIVSHLPARNMRIEFYPTTGAIKHIDIQE